MKRDELSRLDRREYERLMDARRRRQKRYRRFRLFCTLLVMTLLCVTVIFVMTMFFKIQSISVTGVTKYTEAQIVVTSGIKLEENIFRIKTGEIEQRIWEAYPYVEKVKIKRHLPGGVEIQIEQAKPAIALENGNSYVYLSEEMRVLEASAPEPDASMLLIRGIELKNVTDGQMVTFDMARGSTSEADAMRERIGAMQITAAEIFLDYVQQENPMRIDLIDVSDVYNIQLICDNRLIIEIGSLSDLAYKLHFVDKVVREELEPSAMGRIRMSGESKVSFLAENTQTEISRLRAGLPASSGNTFFNDPTPQPDEEGEGEGEEAEDGEEGEEEEE